MDIVQEAKKFAQSEIKKFGAPNLTHFEIAEKKALELATKLKCNQTIVLVGVYLMDLKIGEALKQNRLSEHVKMSAVATKKFLERYDINSEVKNKIINCVEAHHSQVPFICKEAEIVANADCYRFIHPKGVLAFLMMLGKRNMELPEALNYVEEKLDEKWEILSLEICEKELEHHYRAFKNFLKAARDFA